MTQLRKFSCHGKVGTGKWRRWLLKKLQRPRTGFWSEDLPFERRDYVAVCRLRGWCRLMSVDDLFLTPCLVYCSSCCVDKFSKVCGFWRHGSKKCSIFVPCSLSDCRLSARCMQLNLVVETKDETYVRWTFISLLVAKSVFLRCIFSPRPVVFVAVAQDNCREFVFYSEGLLSDTRSRR